MLALKSRLPAPLKRALKILVRPRSVAVLPARVSYEEDGFATTHSAAFQDSPRFARAYAAGRATQSWDHVAWRAHVVAWAAAHAARLDGDFVECGVNRGGYARMVLEYLGSQIESRRFYLLDTFQGIVPQLVSDAEAKNGILDAYHYTDCYEDVQRTFAPFPNVVLIRGMVPDTLARVPSQRVALLSIDMNCVEPEIAAAEYFWDRLVPGAIMVLDDYGHPLHTEQRLAFDAFADRHNVEILSLPTAQGIMIKES